MRIPVMRGVIDRRILVNYHLDPTLVARYLPPQGEAQPSLRRLPWRG